MKIHVVDTQSEKVIVYYDSEIIPRYDEILVIGNNRYYVRMIIHEIEKLHSPFGPEGASTKIIISVELIK